MSLSSVLKKPICDIENNNGRFNAVLCCYCLYIKQVKARYKVHFRTKNKFKDNNILFIVKFGLFA